MIVFVDSESKIRAVGKSSDTSLTPLFIDEADPTYPFTGWSTAKICCYKVSVSDGIVTMMTPYVDSRLIDQIDMMGHSVEAATPYTAEQSMSVGEDEAVFTDVPDGIITIDARDLEGNILKFNATRDGGVIRVIFNDPLTYAADIRLIVN